ncbi:MAG TPA: SCO family protein [Trueperaceae bacterium]|nr:SCO family protein [Trueperaceae bacterium]HRP47044.1 SCO family protein [Trueperaceae bacterium]
MKAPAKVLWFVAAMAVLGVGAFTLGTLLRPRQALGGTELQNPVKVTGLDLVDTRGEPVDLAGDFSGAVTLVFFGFTRCPDVCPLTMARLTHAYEQLGAPDDLNVVLVTVDPGFDTPAVLAEYLKRYHPDFVGLTGSNSQVAEAARAFFVGFVEGGSTIAHTDVVGVVDRDGYLRYIYGQDVVVRLGEDMPELLRRL